MGPSIILLFFHVFAWHLRTFVLHVRDVSILFAQNMLPLMKLSHSISIGISHIHIC